ncbi:hypothetical protein ACH5RR_013042 [Cinchona calisaya]|uniref:Uncharacterized protein n=1 Tax=Cinchona calisaya TaxID=153742 RepID=A0ABD3A2B9_9GENT
MGENWEGNGSRDKSMGDREWWEGDGDFVIKGRLPKKTSKPLGVEPSKPLGEVASGLSIADKVLIPSTPNGVTDLSNGVNPSIEAVPQVVKPTMDGQELECQPVSNSSQTDESKVNDPQSVEVHKPLLADSIHPEIIHVDEAQAVHQAVRSKYGKDGCLGLDNHDNQDLPPYDQVKADLVLVMEENAPSSMESSTNIFKSEVISDPIHTKLNFQIIYDEFFRKLKSRTKKQAQNPDLPALDSLSDSETGELVFVTHHQEVASFQDMDKRLGAVVSCPVSTKKRKGRGKTSLDVKKNNSY